MGSVDPADGATNVPLSSSVRASLILPGEGKLNVTTLTDTAVTLTDASGVAVPAKRTFENGAIVLDPDADLVIDTSYMFNVTSDVETADGAALQVFSSSFSTGDSAPPPPGGGLSATPARVVFTAGSPTGSDTRTLTLTNGGTDTLNVSGLSVTGTDAAQFTLADSSTFSLAPGASRELSLTFNSSGLGPQLATLSVQSSASSLEVPLGGLGVKGQGGNNEPSLQWILDTYGLSISTGDNDPSTTGITDAKTVSNGLLGDEVPGQTFTKASPTEPVTAEVLATFGVENDPVLDFGYYTAGQPDAQTTLFNITQTPTLNAQRLAPEVTATGGTVSGDTVTFDPGTGSFGLYSFWPTNRFFSERTVYTEDALNTFPKALPHQVRTYPLPGEANAYVVATEEFTSGFDYNDVVIILRNVVPAEGEGTTQIPDQPTVPPANGISGLNISNQLGLPYNDRLILQKIENPTGKFCDPTNNPNCDPTVDQWTGIEFPTTGTVELQNTGSSALQLSLSFLNDNLFVFPNGESTINVAPGQTYELEVAFNPVGFDKKGVYPAGLQVESGGQSAGIQLAGLYMLKPEGSREVFFAPLLKELFGYQVVLDEYTNGGLENPAPDSPLAGEEVRSAFWEAANPGSPVSILQIAAFYPCCNIGQFNMKLIDRGDSKTNPFLTLSHSGNDTQSIYPREKNGDLTQASVTPSGAFEINVANSYSTNSRGSNLGVRLWPLRDRSGNLVANSYVVAQDFVKPGCNGFGVPDEPIDGSESEPPGNCDYNDNLYIMENIKPVN